MTVSAGATVGFVGLGRMGQVMAARLVDAGYVVRGYDVDADARSRLAEVGGEASTTSRATATGASVVILMLPDSVAVRTVLVEQGLVAAMNPGSLLIDMGSSDPEETKVLASFAHDRGVRMLDAPVSGGVAGARAGSLTVMVGGDERDLAHAGPLLDVLGAKVVRVGGSGSGHAVKALNNLLVATTLLASCEALEIARRFGIDPELFVETVNGSTGRSHSSEVKLPRFVLTEEFNSGFALNLLVKDARTAVRLAGSIGSSVALGEATLALWERASAALPADADHTEIGRWLAC